MADPQDSDVQAQMSGLFEVETLHNVEPQDGPLRLSPDIERFITEQGEVSYVSASYYLQQASPFGSRQ